MLLSSLRWSTLNRRQGPRGGKLRKSLYCLIYQYSHLLVWPKKFSESFENLWVYSFLCLFFEFFQNLPPPLAVFWEYLFSIERISYFSINISFMKSIIFDVRTPQSTFISINSMKKNYCHLNCQHFCPLQSCIFLFFFVKCVGKK